MLIAVVAEARFSLLRRSAITIIHLLGSDLIVMAVVKTYRCCAGISIRNDVARRACLLICCQQLLDSVAFLVLVALGCDVS